jgi:hypothetical protein
MTPRTAKGRASAWRRPSEKQVQAAVKEMLGKIGCRVYDTSQPMRALITPGVPDLIAFHPRRGLLFIECKAPGGKLSEAQEDFQRLCRQAGIHHIVGGVEDVLAFLVGGHDGS